MERIGIAVWTFEDASLDRKLNTFADMGYTAASVLGNFLDTTARDDLAAVERTIEERDLLLTVHSSFGSPPDGDTAIKQAERILEFHARTGRIARLTYDCPREEISSSVRPMSPRRAIENLEPVLTITAGSGIRVGLEDCPIVPEQMASFSGWTERYPHWGILIDLGHMNRRLRDPDKAWAQADGAEEYLRRIEPEIIEVHVHSNDGTKDQHAPPYTGNADLPTAARVLREMGFSGIHTIELVPAWSGIPPEEALPAAQRSLDFWKELLGCGSS